MGENAPEIIWASPNRGIAYVEDTSKGYPVEGYAKYIRSDIVGDLIDALEAAEQQLDYGQVDAAHQIILRALSRHGEGK